MQLGVIISVLLIQLIWAWVFFSLVTAPSLNTSQLHYVLCVREIFFAWINTCPRESQKSQVRGPCSVNHFLFLYLSCITCNQDFIQVLAFCTTKIKILSSRENQTLYFVSKKITSYMHAICTVSYFILELISESDSARLLYSMYVVHFIS